MAVFVTTGGYFGGFAVRPRKVKGYGPGGDPIYTPSIRISIRRLGINKDTKQAEGMFDTSALPGTVVRDCKAVYGEEGWEEKLIAEIEDLHLPLRLLKKGETTNVEKDGVRVVLGTRTVGHVRHGDKSLPAQVEAEKAKAEK